MASVSYPHPVLGNGDDVAIGTIEPVVTFACSDEAVVVEARGLTSGNPTIDGLVAATDAEWVMRLQCARTYVRKELITKEAIFHAVFAGHELEGRVEVELFVRAARDLAGYVPDGAHADYAGTSFDLRTGEILAIAPSMSFDVDRQFDPMRAPVGSIIRVSKGEHEEGPFRVAFEDEYIEILLSHEDWEHYAGVRERTPGILHAALVLPVLAEAVPRTAEFAGRRWADRLSAMIEARRIDVEQPLEAAQKLLESPLTRAFAELNVALDQEL